jgi:hypothetical protein
MVARLISTLCSYPVEDGGRIRNVLPQGAPTSPILSNIACTVMDTRLQGLADRFGLTYTRYADDITFSGDRKPYSPGGGFFLREFLPELESILEDNGFSMNVKKTRLLHCGQRLEVTGLTVGEKVNVPRRYMKNLRAAIHQLEQGLPDTELLRQADGRLAYLGMVRGKDDPAYRRLRHRLGRIKNFLRTMP